MIIINHLEKHDIFELTEAIYTWCILHNNGIWSDEYACQCDISTVYQPGMGFSESDIEENNYFYHDIDEDNYQILWDKVKWYLDNKWQDE